jgi:hypothetical protein
MKDNADYPLVIIAWRGLRRWTFHCWNLLQIIVELYDPQELPMIQGLLQPQDGQMWEVRILTYPILVLLDSYATTHRLDLGIHPWKFNWIIHDISHQALQSPMRLSCAVFFHPPVGEKDWPSLIMSHHGDHKTWKWPEDGRARELNCLADSIGMFGDIHSNSIHESEEKET